MYSLVTLYLGACRRAASSNNHMHSDSKKRRSFVALFFAAGDVRRCPVPAQGVVYFQYFPPFPTLLRKNNGRVNLITVHMCV